MRDALLRQWIRWHSDERGMEAAQVILILAVVVAILFPVISGIVAAIEQQGNDAVNDIRNF